MTRGARCPDRRRQPGRPVDRAVPAAPRSQLPGGGTAHEHRDPPARRPLPAPHGGDPPRGRARGGGPAQGGGAVPPERRHQQRRVARRPRDRELLREPERRGRGVQPDRAAVHRPGRARADPPRPRRGARGRAPLPGRVRVACAGRVGGDRDVARSRRRYRTDRADAIRRRRGWEPEPDPRPARDRDARPRPAVEQRHDLLPLRGRPEPAARGARPGRELRHEPGPAGVLPARPNRQPRLPRRQPRRRHRAARGRRGLPERAVGEHRRDDRRAARARAAPCRDRGSRHTRGRSRTWRRGERWPTAPSATRTAACSWPATPPTRCRPTVGSAATPACRTRSIWPGSWGSSWAAWPAPSCSTPTTPSGARSAR